MKQSNRMAPESFILQRRNFWLIFLDRIYGPQCYQCMCANYFENETAIHLGFEVIHCTLMITVTRRSMNSSYRWYTSETSDIIFSSSCFGIIWGDTELHSQSIRAQFNYETQYTSLNRERQLGSYILLLNTGRPQTFKQVSASILLAYLH